LGESSSRATLGNPAAAMREGVAVFGFVIATHLGGSAAENLRGLGCTAIAVDGRGTVDGSGFAGMNADCSSCDGRVAYIPRSEHPEGAMRPLYITGGAAPRFVGYGRGSFYEPKAGEALTPKIGEIPQVRSTFAYWEATLPLMNEKGLALGESSCGAALMNYPKGQAVPLGHGDPRTGKGAIEGLIDLTNMMQIALERCATARCGVQTMGAIAEEYGFFPTVGEPSLGLQTDGTMAFEDGGEALTLTDRSGEAWIFHVVGGVPGVTKSVWAAMRVPKGHAGFIANNFVLREVPEEQNEDWLFSSNIREAARASKLWDGKEPLDFARVFSFDDATFQSPPGEAPVPLYATLRQWRLLGIAAPKAWGQRRLPVDPLELPVTVEVEKPMGHQDVFRFLSDTYEGTEFDMTQGILAGPFGNPFRIEGGDARYVGQLPRGLSIARTLYSFIGQSRPSEEPVLWIAPDAPVSSVYVPFYATAGPAHAPAYSTGVMNKFSRQSAWWAHDFVANWASLQNWQNASKQFILPLRSKLHNEIQEEMPAVEARAKKEGVQVLAEWQTRTQQRVVDRWWRLADELVVAYNDGFFNDAKSNQMGLSMGYPTWWAHAIGFNQDVHPIYVKRDFNPYESCLVNPLVCDPHLHAIRSPLPASFDFNTFTWLSAAEGTTQLSELANTAAPVTVQLLAMASMLLIGLIIGRTFERRRMCASGVLDQSQYLLQA